MLGKHLLVNQFAPTDLSNIQTPLGSVGDVHLDTLAISWLCMGGILGFALAIRPALVADGPGGTGQAIAEGFYKFIDDLAHSQIGHRYKPFVPLIASIFIFVLIANFSGIGPWAAGEHFPNWPHCGAPNQKELWEIASPTTDFNVTLGLALLALVVYLGSGVKQHGIHYVKLFFSPMAPIEYMDLVIRPLTLALRLLLVITADELTRMVFLFMLPWIAPTFVMAFEIFIAIIQAFVFALLTSIYIGLAVAEHH